MPGSYLHRHVDGDVLERLPSAQCDHFARHALGVTDSVIVRTEAHRKSALVDARPLRLPLRLEVALKNLPDDAIRRHGSAGNLDVR